MIGFDLLRDTLALAVPLRIMDVQAMPAWERDALATWAGQQFQYADVMLYDPQRKSGQFTHLGRTGRTCRTCQIARSAARRAGRPTRLRGAA